jgi:hypothetical protein
MTSSSERRQQPRPTPIAPNWNQRLELGLSRVWHGIRAPARGIALLWLLTIGSMAWTLWTLDVRLEPLQGWRHSVQNEIGLRSELAAFERRWSPHTLARSRDDVAEAQRRMLGGYPELSAWLHQQAAAALSAGIVINYTFAATEPMPGAASLTVVPIEFTFKIRDRDAAKLGYGRLMRQLSVLLDAPFAMELKGAAIEAADGNAQLMRLTMNIWMLKQTAPGALANDPTEADAPRVANNP